MCVCEHLQTFEWERSFSNTVFGETKTEIRAFFFCSLSRKQPRVSVFSAERRNPKPQRRIEYCARRRTSLEPQGGSRSSPSTHASCTMHRSTDASHDKILMAHLKTLAVNAWQCVKNLMSVFYGFDRVRDKASVTRGKVRCVRNTAPSTPSSRHWFQIFDIRAPEFYCPPLPSLL